VIVGLGNPGKGIPPSQSSASALASASASGGANQETQVISLESSESAVKGSGFPAGGITGLVLASIVVSLATRLSTGDTEVMMVQRQAWSRFSPGV
jgi:hypothetical protein